MLLKKMILCLAIMGNKSRINEEIYKNIVDALRSGNQRVDSSYVLSEIERGWIDIFAAYKRRGIDKRDWRSMYGALVRIAEGEVGRQEREIEKAMKRVPGSGIDLYHRHF